MPVEMARRISTISGELRVLDIMLADLVGRLGPRCMALRDATRCGNEPKRIECEAFLKAELMVYRHFFAEIADRKIPKAALPRATAAVSSGLTVARGMRAEMLAQMPMTGAVH
jgi:hypothetical protein